MANFNVPPYFDDYNEDKGYYKILFRPSVAIQARELNQMQSMLQKQIERFGSHIFREGSIVVGGAFDLELDMAYIKASAVTPAPKRLQEFVGKSVTGLTSGIKAYIRAAVYDEVNNVYVFLLRYLSSSTTSSAFLNEEVVKVDDDASFTFTVSPSTVAAVTGVGSTFSIGQGVVFSKGYFLAFPSQTVIVDKYSANPTATIGLQVSESFVTDLTDESLLDNALGSTNENAPGAHRYQLEAKLVSIAYKNGYDDENFIPFMDINSGVIEVTQERSQYAKIYDELAKRTFDESGDYYVRGFNVRTREHLDTGNNEGLFSNTDPTPGNSSLLSIDVEPGIAYVKGYEVNKLVTEHIITDKAVTYNYVNNQLVNARTGGYFLIKEIVGSADHDKAIQVNLFTNPETRITSNIKSDQAAYANNVKIGTALLKALVYESGQLGTNTAQMRAYLYDFNMSNGYVISDVGSVSTNTSGNFLFADVVANTSFNDDNNNVLLFPLGAPHIRTIRSNTGSSDTSYQFNRSSDVTLNYAAGGTTSTPLISTTGEALSYSDGFLSVAEKRELILSISADKIITFTGNTVATANATTRTLTGTGTDFTKLKPGDRILIGGNVEHYVASISSPTSLELASPGGATFTANTLARYFKVGDVIDLTSNGSTGSAITASVSGGVLNIDLKEVVGTGTGGAKLTYRVERDTGTAGGEIRKLLRANRFVQIQTNTNVSGTSGPFNLGLPDVYKIRSVRLHNSAFSTGAEGSNVTSSFTLDNGQRDNYYDHGKLVLNGSLDLTNKNLLIELDHFEADYSTGLGYFSVDSYPVNDNAASNTSIFTYEIPKYTATSGVNYDLRNVLDFRAYKSNTATSATTVGTATLNPALTTNFAIDANGLRMVAPDSDITTDYSFYLARRDVVTLDKQGIFNVIKGEPSVSPISPNVPDNVMGIANIYIPPYPSVSETLARLINDRNIGCVSRKIAQIRYTMREIGVLKNRIENLEYYNALTMLEKSAVDLKVTDSSGLDRFKNGFFVDGFLDHSLGDSGNVDYKIAIDKIEQTIRPFFELDSFQYKLETSGSSGYKQTGNLITRPYDEVTLLENRNVTTIRNIEQGVFRFIGTIEVTPDGDTWCDSTTVDKTISFGNEIPIKDTLKTEWGSWETYAVGYNVYDRNIGDRSGNIDPNKYLGSYTSYAAAVAATKSTPYYKNNKVQGSQKDDRALIQTVTSDKRVGIQTKITSETQIEELGNFVTDVSVKPYIRPQTLTVTVKGLKANTRYYLYFDGENMSSFTTPIKFTDIQNGGISITAEEEGSAWRSDEYGEAFAYLRLPDTGKKFRTGTKEIIVTDSPTNAIDATSYAKTHWTAIGISAQKQNTILSTKVPVIQQEEIVETRQKQQVQVMGPSCMAYSFKVDVPRGEDGIFLTSVDVWVEAKHPTLGTWFEIREMNSAGGITRTQVPYSEVWLKSSDFNLWDGTAGTEETKKTKITFPAPVFLLNNTQYAFVIHTEGLNPDYYFWVSRLGETDVLTGKQVTSRQITGTLYTTNNNLNYDMVPDVDLKVRFNRADFDIGTGTVILGNKPTEFLKLSSVSGSFIRSGETIATSEVLTLSNTTNTTSGSITVGDKITSTNTSGNSVTGNVIAISGSLYYTDAIGFSNAVSYTFANSTGGNISITGNVQSVSSGSGTLRSYNSTNNFMIIDNSNGKFYTNAVIKGVISGNTARIGNSSISGFTQFNYSTTTLKPYYLLFNSTAVSFEKAGWRSNPAANNFDLYDGNSEWFPGTSDSYSSFNNEVTILSHVNEIAKFGNTSPNSSARVKVVMNTSSPYVSPVVDLSRAQSIYVHNIINNDDTGEANSSGGNLLNKYLSKPVTLADGQDAEDLLVKLTAYRPPNSDVKVWMKVRNGEDGTLFDQNPWVEMTYSNSFFSSEANKDDFIELDYTVPDSLKNGNGVIQYAKNKINVTANSTGYDATNNVIYVANANLIYRLNDEVYYSVPTGNTAIPGLTSNTYYYVYLINSSSIGLSTNIGVDRTVVANSTGFSNTDDTFLFTAANSTFTSNDVVYYSVPTGNTPVAPLTGNTYYFVSFSNTTTIKLSTTRGGANINITDARVTATAENHTFTRWTGTDILYTTTTSPAEIHTIGGEVYTGFKQYSVKIGLKGTNSAKPPRVGDLRVIALQM